MTTAISSFAEIQARARELAGTVREGLLHLLDHESPEIRLLLGDALAAVEASVDGHRQVRAASDALRTLLEQCRGRRPDRQPTLAALGEYDQALAEALPGAPAVKLVVWDLDDTFWHGTLSEGDTPEVPLPLSRSSRS